MSAGRRRPSCTKRDADVLGVISAFKAAFSPAKPQEFGSVARQLFGLFDRPDGVQWSGWFNCRASVAELAVNLEGTEHDDWPIGRFISRETDADSELLHTLRKIEPGADVRVVWKRDVWSAGHKVRVDAFLDVPHVGLARDAWVKALQIARSCLAPDLRGRGRQLIHLKDGAAKPMDVTPHLQFVTPLWSSFPAGHPARLDRMTRARELLEPLHEYVSKQAA